MNTHTAHTGKRMLLVVMLLAINGFFLVVKEYAPSTAADSPPRLVADSPLAVYAQQIMDACAEERYRPSCYDEAIPELLGEISYEDTFAVARIIQQEDGDYWYCHVLGHNVSAAETAKDPAKWKDVIARSPRGICSNGAIHGAFQERFRAEYLNDEQISALIPELQTICEPRKNWNPTGMEQASCYHALGHLTMYMTNAEASRALDVCERSIPDGDRRSAHIQVCYDGVFMQIFQPLEPEDFALIEGKVPKKEEVESFCAAFPEKAAGSCWNESWPMHLASLKSAPGTEAFCDVLSDALRERCYDAMFFVMTAQFRFDADKIISYCGEFTSGRRGQCFGNAAARIIETDYSLGSDSVAVCLAAEAYDADEPCFSELLVYSRFNFHPGTDAFDAFCDAMPEPWASRCRTGDIKSSGETGESV